MPVDGAVIIIIKNHTQMHIHRYIYIRTNNVRIIYTGIENNNTQHRHNWFYMK